jgi:peptide chain release factor 1
MDAIEPLVAEIERAFADVERRLQDPEVFGDPAKVADLGRQHRRLKDANDLATAWRAARQQRDDAAEMLDAESDAETREFLQAELESARDVLPELEEKIRLEMVERDPADDKNVIVEIRAGTGGDEAALFAGDVYRMLTRYAERRGFKHQTLAADPSEAGGFRDVTFEINGDGAYSVFKWESGVHRVQRVPATETQGRIHTSTATVAVLPEAEEVDVKLDPKDLEIETIRGWGPGGQSVNTTDSAVRVTHRPSGLMVVCQDERSQLQNKERALRILRARLYEQERERAAQELSEARRSQIGSGMRAEKIRTYNYPQSRITDHRIKFTTHNLQGALLGELDDLTDALQAEDNRQRLAAAAAPQGVS